MAGVSAEILSTIQALDGFAMAFPPTNADGSANTAAQSAAISGIISAAVASGALDFSSIGISQDQAAKFAVALLPIIAAYKAATNRPTM